MLLFYRLRVDTIYLNLDRVKLKTLLFSVFAVIFCAMLAPLVLAPLANNQANADPGQYSVDIDYIVEPSLSVSGTAY